MFDHFLPAGSRNVYRYAFVQFVSEKNEFVTCSVIGMDANLRTHVRSSRIQALSCNEQGLPVAATTESGSQYTFDGQPLTSLNDDNDMVRWLESAIGLDRGAIYQLIDGKRMNMEQFAEIEALNQQLQDKIDAEIELIEHNGELVGIKTEYLTAQIIDATKVLKLIDSGYQFEARV